MRTMKEPLGGQRDLHEVHGSTGPVSKTQQISSMSRCSLKANADAEFAIDDSKKPRPCQLTDDDIVKNFGKCFSDLI